MEYSCQVEILGATGETSACKAKQIHPNLLIHHGQVFKSPNVDAILNFRNMVLLPAYCTEEMSFVCSLPEMCHHDICHQKCSAEKDNSLCKISSPELQPPKCFPRCPSRDCSDTVFTTIQLKKIIL